MVTLGLVSFEMRGCGEWHVVIGVACGGLCFLVSGVWCEVLKGVCEFR